MEKLNDYQTSLILVGAPSIVSIVTMLTGMALNEWVTFSVGAVQVMTSLVVTAWAWVIVVLVHLERKHEKQPVE